MRYLNQICSMYSVVVKVFNHIVFVYFRYPVDKIGTPQEKAQYV